MPVFDHFDFLAPKYDRFIKAKDLTRLVQLIDLPTDGRLLDAGGGTGRISSEIVAHTGSTIIADLSLGMLRQASCKNGIIPLCSLTESLPFPDESFDRVIMIDALHHVYSHSKTANELWRVIKPGGRIVIEEPNIHKPAVWVVAILEKLAFMRSHIISSGKISNLFKDPKAKVISEQQGYAIWIIIQKILI